MGETLIGRRAWIGTLTSPVSVSGDLEVATPICLCGGRTTEVGSIG